MSQRHLDEEKLRAILEEIVKCIVTDPYDIAVAFTRGDQTTVYQVRCQQRSIGQIIGSKGRTIQSIRNIVSVSGATRGFHAVVEIPYFP